jgi:hypothetical protein
VAYLTNVEIFWLAFVSSFSAFAACAYVVAIVIDYVESRPRGNTTAAWKKRIRRQWAREVHPAPRHDLIIKTNRMW